eukprot:evm.model.scf_1145EXC.3 EVM.evm.TU.scf_1145EXC.3   scf_1145EXC:18996-20579(-)
MQAHWLAQCCLGTMEWHNLSVWYSTCSHKARNDSQEHSLEEHTGRTFGTWLSKHVVVIAETGGVAIRLVSLIHAAAAEHFKDFWSLLCPSNDHPDAGNALFCEWLRLTQESLTLLRGIMTCSGESKAEEAVHEEAALEDLTANRNSTRVVLCTMQKLAKLDEAKLSFSLMQPPLRLPPWVRAIGTSSVSSSDFGRYSGCGRCCVVNLGESCSGELRPSCQGFDHRAISASVAWIGYIIGYATKCRALSLWCYVVCTKSPQVVCFDGHFHIRRSKMCDTTKDWTSMLF